MSSAGTRERLLPVKLTVPGFTFIEGKTISHTPSSQVTLANGKQITVSSSNYLDRKTGHYNSGGNFYSSRVEWFINPGHVGGATKVEPWGRIKYSGPICCKFPTSAEMKALGFANESLKYGSKNESSMKTAGTNAISYCSPTNPASSLGVGVSEALKEGLPSLPGVPTWRERTKILKGLGSEFLNAEFGWLPLKSEVEDVSKAARKSRDIMEQYQNGSGRNSHRRFDYPLKAASSRQDSGTEYPLMIAVDTGFLDPDFIPNVALRPRRTVSVVSETKRWFEGLFSYAVPSQSDSWGAMLGFGTEADKLYGLALSPEILWELTPWSWAVDWFSNAGEVVNNATNFGLAGLSMRYGYIMEESIEEVTAELDGCHFRSELSDGKFGTTKSGSSSCGIKCVTKRRVPASPFGFSVGWEGLSPTQLAITAALGITRSL